MIDYVPPRWATERPQCAGNPDPELWSYYFPKGEDDRLMQAYRIIEAQDICEECPVREACLQQGLKDENMLSGTIWGGLTFYQRQKITGRHKWRIIPGESDMFHLTRKLRVTRDRKESA